MASISTRPSGSRFISFVAPCGERRHITLGQVAKRYAEAVKVRVEDLASAAIHGHPPTDDTARWVKSIDERLYAKLAAVDLLPDREDATLGGAIAAYLDSREGELKPESLRKLRQTEAKLLDFFDSSKPLRKLTGAEASAWRKSLKGLGLSEAAIKTHCGNAKSILAEAVRRKLVEDNPFEGLPTGPTPSDYTRYVTPEEIEAVIEACPDAEWRLLFGLARYAGLRVPSESHGLRWADVDFDRARLTVRSPKTERYAGHERRVVPITPRLMALMQDRFEAAPEGEAPLVMVGSSGAVIRRVRKLCAKAGVKPWERLWQTLRSSCEKEWAMHFPQYAVSKWIGHSIVVSGRHYANAVPDELYERARGAGCERSAQQNAQLKVAETTRNAP